MSTWTLLQIFVNLTLGLGLAVMWVRLRRPPQDDPRLSRGLQLLQSKIAVLEDLSDRTDAQVKQLTHLIEQKARLLQNKIIESEHQIHRVDQSMQKSKEVAEIFQDKIPHQEIIERQQTIKYVKAAQMAHSGHSIDEIAATVDLPKGQLELIAKLNREELVFDAEALPEWAKGEAPQASLGDAEAKAEALTSEVLQNVFAPPEEEYASLKRLGEQFRTACVEFDQAQIPLPNPLQILAESAKPALTSAAATLSEETAVLVSGARKVTSKLMTSASDLLGSSEEKMKTLTRSQTPNSTAAQKSAKGPSPASSGEIKKVEFPQVDLSKN